MSTSAIIADDEPHLVEYLAGKLAKLWPELEIAGKAFNGREAIELAGRTRPDIAFLDIHMPGLSGLEVASALPKSTKIVFVTAFDEFAVEAFQRAAVDYLLKPVSDSRLQQTLNRLRENTDQDRSELLELLRQIKQPHTQYLQWIRAGHNDLTTLLAVEELIYAKADQKYTSIITRNHEYVVRRSIKELAGQLDPDQFWRIHRGLIVRVEQIQSARRDYRGRYTISLKDHPDTLRSSQNYGHLFKQM